MYVWFDALTNYMTAAGYGSSDPADLARFARWWPADVHLIGKEIVRQHAIYLAGVAAGRGHAASAAGRRPRLVADGRREDVQVARQCRAAAGGYIDRFGVDALRYFVFREMVFGQDATSPTKRS